MNNLRWWVQIILFLSSYVPLSVILFVLVLPTHEYVFAVVTLGIGLLSLGSLIFFIAKTQSLQPFYDTITSSQRRDNEIMSYIATYIFPFVTLPFSDWSKGIAYIILLGTIGVLYINSNLIYINPMLSLMRYHLYEVTLSQSDSVFLVLSKRVVKKGDMLPLIKMSEGIFMEKKSWRQPGQDERESQ